MKPFVGFAAAAVAVAASVGLWAQSGSAQRGARAQVAPGDWPNLNRDLAATRYSPLNQINTGNVSSLTQAWAYRLGGGATAVPLVVSGVMYVPSGTRVVALDADTGKEIWAYALPPLPAAPRPATDAQAPVGPAPAAPPPGLAGAGAGRRGGGPPPGPTVSARGVGYWPGDGSLAPRVMFMSGSRLFAVDAMTGIPVAGFGTNGVVNVGVPYNGTPTLYRNVVIIGANVNEVPQGPAGNPRAFDARTGAKLWEFQTVPRPGEKSNDTWGKGWKDRSGTNMWAFAAPVDVERGIVYLPIAGPAANYYGGDRPGNNDYANSIVAVDAQTGKYLWHFQTVHHDLWDSDIPSAGGLVEVVQNGRRVPAIAHVGKTSYLFVLNRVTGKPIIPVEERPVPKGDVPTEWYSATQPFPVRPGPLSRVSFKKEDMVTAADTTPEHVAACQALWDKSGGFYNAGPFTPFMFHAKGTPPKSTIQFPGGTGGVNWGGMAVDPNTGYIFVNAQNTSLVGWVEEKDPNVDYSFDARGSKQPYERASVNGVGPFFTFNAPLNGYDADGRPRPGPSLPCQRPPWSKLIAVNVNTGQIAWESVLGVNDALPEGKRLVGNSGSAGPTVTAGGLVFVGATNDRRFRAFDAKTGKELWVSMTEANANANPMTYQGTSGKQHVAVIAGNTLLSFALP
jgi:quinoprotein glucose dehydrogenase